MSGLIAALEKRVCEGGGLNREEALLLSTENLEELSQAANRIRLRLCGNDFDLCAILNARSGRCPENCAYCAQSSHFDTHISEFPLLGASEIAQSARLGERQGVRRFSIVTSGRRLTDGEVEQVCEAVREIRRASRISVCASCGLLTPAQFGRLKEAGVARYHNNLETSRRFFPSICTTHSYEEKIGAIQSAREAGLYVCSGGIIGLGETVEDRVDLALTLRSLSIKSVPVNVLTPIPGTPLAGQKRLSYEEVIRTLALFRFLLPDAAIRTAAGRTAMPDRGARAFLSGANAAISGDLLTTSGVRTADDRSMLGSLGYTFGEAKV